MHVANIVCDTLHKYLGRVVLIHYCTCHFVINGNFPTNFQDQLVLNKISTFLFQNLLIEVLSFRWTALFMTAVYLSIEEIYVDFLMLMFTDETGPYSRNRMMITESTSLK